MARRLTRRTSPHRRRRRRPSHRRQARAIAKEAYIYGFPMVDNYRVMYSYFVNKQDPEYKGGWNQIHSTARVYTPEDKTIQTPNSDTPYSSVGADLRTEPLVLDRAADRAEPLLLAAVRRRLHLQLRLRRQPHHRQRRGQVPARRADWKGDKPEGVNEVIRSDTDLLLVLYRTQLFGPSDIEKRQGDPGGIPGDSAVGFPQPAAAGARAGDRLRAAADARTSRRPRRSSSRS